MGKPRSVHIIEVPYHLGRRRSGWGVGSQRLLDAGVVRQLQRRGYAVDTSSVSRRGRFDHEVGAAFAVAREVARRIRSTVVEGAFPLVLAGDCSVALGVLAGLGSDVGVVWLDAHGDFNTPETTVTGYFGGMPLAAAVGRCWQAMCLTLPGFRPIPEEHVALIGVRATDALEARLLADSQIRLVSPEMMHTQGAARALVPTFEALRCKTKSVYLHVDMDVLDPQVARANAYAEPDGLSVAEVETAIRKLDQSLPVAAAALTAYDPRYDETRAALQAGLRLITTIAQASAGYQLKG